MTSINTFALGSCDPAWLGSQYEDLGPHIYTHRYLRWAKGIYEIHKCSECLLLRFFDTVRISTLHTKLYFLLFFALNNGLLYPFSLIFTFLAKMRLSSSHDFLRRLYCFTASALAATDPSATLGEWIPLH